MNEELNQVLKQVQKRFEGDRFAYLSGCRIQSVEDGQACCTMEITENHLNAAGTVMGGAISVSYTHLDVYKRQVNPLIL